MERAVEGGSTPPRTVDVTPLAVPLPLPLPLPEVVPLDTALVPVRAASIRRITALDAPGPTAPPPTAETPDAPALDAGTGADDEDANVAPVVDTAALAADEEGASGVPVVLPVPPPRGFNARSLLWTAARAAVAAFSPAAALPLLECMLPGALVVVGVCAA